MKRPVYIVDAMNYIFRAYHSLPREIAAPSGMTTNAVFGYARTLLRIGVSPARRTASTAFSTICG